MHGTIDDAIEKLRDLGLSRAIHDAEASEAIARVYRQLFGEPFTCTTCPGKLAQAYQKIITYFYASNGKTMATKNYELKTNGALFITRPLKGVPRYVSNANLTDEIAEALLTDEVYSKWVIKKKKVTAEASIEAAQGEAKKKQSGKKG